MFSFACRFECKICNKRIKCDHMGRREVVKHSETQSHKDLAKSFHSQSRLQVSTMGMSNQRLTAEMKMAVLTASSNVSLAFHDKLSPMIRSVFPDSRIASNYHSASTKATCMLNLAVAPILIEDLVKSMKEHPFSISTDGSNDTGLEKMNPATVRIYDLKENCVSTRFLDMCVSSSSTAHSLYNSLNGKLEELLQHPNPWDLCTSVGVDNTSVNIGIRDSIKTRVLERNSSVFFNGCPCHIIHNAARKASDELCSFCGFDIEELCIDIFYWFEKSTKRKNGLQSYCTFCDQEYRAMMKHVTTRWLSLERAVERVLKQYESLKSYFRSENEAQPRFKRLYDLFEDPMTEVYLLFFQSILPCFTHTNQFLQREEPLIHVLQPQLLNLFKKILGKFVKPSILSLHVNADTLTSVDFSTISNQVLDKDLAIGFLTKQMVNKLYEEGDITNVQKDKFFNAARKFFVCAAAYLLKWCPLEEDLLIHATWLDFERRLEKNFTSIEYFIHRFPTLLGSVNLDKLNEEFINYQMLSSSDIPTTIKQSSNLREEDPHRVDVLWGYLRGIKEPGSSQLMFGLLFRVAEVMTIPHSNAGEERIFSFINKNKTPSRSSLQLEGTLSSLLLIKTHISDPLTWEPSNVMLEKAKGATRAYNEQHK